MRTLKRAVALLIVMVFMITLVPATVFAANDGYKDVPENHWAYSAISEWSSSENAILFGYGDGNFGPDDSIRANDLDIIFARLLGKTEKPWAASLELTREQAAKVIAVELGLDPVESPNSNDLYADDEEIGNAYKPYVYALKAHGYQHGIGSNTYAPKSQFTRAEIIQTIYNAVSAITDTDVTGKTFGTNLIVRTAGVTIKDTVVNGDLIIAQGVGEGDVHLDNVTVKGNTIVYGGGKNSIYAADFRCEGSLIVRKYEGENKVRIVVTGACNFDAIVLESGAILVTQELSDGTKISVEIAADYLAGSEFEFIGSFNNIVNNGANADITLTGSVNKLTLNESATVGGSGKIVTAEIAADAGTGTSFETKPTSITGAGKDDVTLPSSSSNSSTGGGGGGGGGGGTADVSVTSVAALAETVSHNEVYTLPATVTAVLADGNTKDFAVTWDDDASTLTCGVFEFEGTLTMVSGYDNPNNVKANLTLTVTATLSSIEITQNPAIVLYISGDALDITGIIVTATYSDGSTEIIPLTIDNVTGFDSETIGEQTLTVTYDGMTATFTIEVLPAVSGTIVSIPALNAVVVANGAAATAEGLELPARTKILVDTGEENPVETLANVSWIMPEASAYDPTIKTEQSFTVFGTVTLPVGVENDEEAPVSLDVSIDVTVMIAQYSVSFDLNGQPGAAILAQTIDYNAYATEPASPTSVSHTFIGWYQNADGTGEAWIFDSDAVTEALVLYAKWQIKTYTVSFDKGNADSEPTDMPSALSVDHGSAAVMPSNPSFAGYSFAGWYTDATLNTAYNWNTPVTSSFTLYAKFADTLSLAADEVTFDLIKGANPNEQSITSDLALLTTLIDYPGVTISWESSVPGTISNAGTVTRPTDADAEVALTATISLGGVDTTKTFNLIVRKTGIGDINIEGNDERYAPGYPVVSFDSTGAATVKIKLKPGSATDANPVWAYLVFDSNTGSNYTMDRESILYGHVVSTAEQDGKHYVWIPSSVAELVITGDEEVSYTTNALWSNWRGEYKIGMVMLENDDLHDQKSAATVIKISAEEIGYIDMQAPNRMNPFLNNDGETIYVYFDEKLSEAPVNKPAPDDFVLSGPGASGITVTGVEITNNTEDHSFMPGCVTLTLSGAITNKENLYLTYTPGTNIITDLSTNPVLNPINASLITTVPSAKAYINPTAGTMMVYFEPGLHYWSGDNYDRLIDLISLKFNDSDITLHRDTGMFSVDYTETFFTFAPMQSGNYTTSQFDLSVATGLKFFSWDTIIVSGQSAEQVLPQVTSAGITAEYDTYMGGSIKLTFPAGTNLGSFSVAACCFTLTIDGQRVLYRDAARTLYHGESAYQDNVIYMPLSERLKDAINNGTSISISYYPDEHIKQAHTHINDISGAYIPAFESVNVIIK